MRTIIDLPDDQVQKLADYCRREKVSRAEAVRRAVDRLVNDAADMKARREVALAATFGMWKDRGIDTDTYLNELRSEWER